eukprot:Hpha_TRINITY_DN6227_c0_g1::TRINITY_DN6227_c0_g1_i1::g.23680::m.23680
MGSVVRWGAAAAFLTCVVGDCGYDFTQGVREHADLFYAGCWSPTSILMAREAERDGVNRSHLSNGSTPRGHVIESLGDCITQCIGEGIHATHPTMGQGGRAPVQVLWREGMKGSVGACVCIVCPCEYGSLYGARDTDNRFCKKDDNWVALYQVPLHCADMDHDTCTSNENKDSCDYGGRCCYAENAFMENPVWRISRQLLQWVFLIIAGAFVLQMFVYSLIRIRTAAEETRREGSVYGSELSEHMITATAEQYRRMFDNLPTADAQPDGTGTMCSICLEDLNFTSPGGVDDPDMRCVGLPDCGHRFHCACIRTYAAHEVQKSRQAVCPNCRKPPVGTTALGGVQKSRQA